MIERLELKVPPPLIAAVFAAAIWGAAALWPALSWPQTRAVDWIFGSVFGVAGIAVALAGVLAFRRHRTTVHPLRPHEASCVVADGVYRHTRNPMYLGLALVLLGWALACANVVSLLLVPAFVATLQRLQIVPEERALAAKFGADYAVYRQRVRRWL